MTYGEMSPTRYLFYILFHPVTGFEEMKFNRKGSLKLANAVCVLFCAAVVVNQVLSAFLFRKGKTEDFMVACGLYRAAFAFLTVKLAFLHAFGRKRAFFRNMDSFVLLYAAVCHGINSAYTGRAFVYK